MTNQPPQIPVPLPVIEGVVNYLLRQPMSEVERGVQELRAAVQRHQQVEQQKAKDAKDPAVDKATMDLIDRAAKRRAEMKKVDQPEPEED